MRRIFAMIAVLFLAFSAIPLPAAAESPIPILGTNDGSSYANEYLGLGCTLGSDWRLYSDWQVIQLNLESLDIPDKENLAVVANAEKLIGLFAENTADGSNLNLAMDRSGAVLSAAEYRDLALPQAQRAAEAMQAEDVTVEPCELEFLWQSTPGLQIRCRLNGVQMYQLQVFVLVEDCIVSITTASRLEDTTRQILDRFYPVARLPLPPLLSYINTELDLGCLLDDGWKTASGSQLQKLFPSVTSSGNYTIDFYAENSTNNAAIQLTLENVLFPLSADEYRGWVSSRSAQLISEYRSMGMKKITVEECQLEFLDSSAPGLRLSYQDQGIPCCKTQVYLRSGNTIACICVTTQQEDTAADILSCFVPLEQ